MRITSLTLTILAVCAGTAGASTFNMATYIPDERVEMLTRAVAQEKVERNLFGDPYATVVIGNVDVYDRFPYLESRYFQIVSDPAWNRLLMGEAGRELAASTGEGFGALDRPRGLATDAAGRLYVADSGNDRVLVYQTVTEYDRITLTPLFEIDGLASPYDVAYSDAGTPYNDDDDVLYVANTGRSEVRRYRLTGSGAELTNTLGSLGSGEGRFAGPMAIAVGRRNGSNDADVYVSDAHNGRIVHLRDTGSGFAWMGEAQHRFGTLTSLDTDHWGNVYAAAPQSGTLAKFTADLFPLAGYSTDIARPRSFHVVFANVTDHRTGTRTRSGQGNGILVEQWSDNSGIRLLDLGVEMRDATPVSGDGTGVRLTLTDRASVTVEMHDARDGRLIARHDAGMLAAGSQTIRFADDDYVAEYTAGAYTLTLHAASTYDNSRTADVEVSLEMTSGGGRTLPAELTLDGNVPNPFNPSTMIRFSVPAGPTRAYSVRVYNIRGALVRTLASGSIDAGAHEVQWDGRNDAGTPVSSGVYLYRVEAGSETATAKMVLLK